MNRFKFTQDIPRFTCDSCSKPLRKLTGFYSLATDKKICRPCYENPKHNKIYEKMDPFSAWKKKVNSPVIFPNLLFFDGRNILDLETKEYIHMKPVDIQIYYFRVRDEKDYEIYTDIEEDE